VLDSSGTILSQQRYKAFGEVRGDLGPINETDFGYTGQREMDITTTNLMDYNARFYQPSLGRFTQPDTIIPSLKNPQTLNRFAYTNNNPVRFVDPSGHRYCELEEKKCEPEEGAVYNPRSIPNPAIPGHTLKEWEIKLLALAVYSETQNGKWAGHLQSKIAWDFLNRLTLIPKRFPSMWHAVKGDQSALTCLYQTDKETMERCNTTEDDVFDYPNPGSASWTNALWDEIMGGAFAAALSNTYQVVLQAYEDWREYGSTSWADPTNGSTDFSVLSQEAYESNDYDVPGNQKTQEWRAKTWPGYKFEYVYFYEPTIGDLYLLLNNRSLMFSNDPTIE